jgi:hypothetical protein
MLLLEKRKDERESEEVKSTVSMDEEDIRTRGISSSSFACCSAAGLPEPRLGPCQL